MHTLDVALPDFLPHIAPMKRSDAGLLARWIADGRRSGGFSPGSSVTARSLLDFQRRLRESGWNYDCHVLRVGGSPAGYCDMRYLGRRAEVLGVYIDPAYRKLSLGSLMLRHSVATLRERACSEVRVEVFADNRSSLRMCARVGFERVRAFRRRHEPRNAVLLTRRIAPWARLSPLDPRYLRLRGANLFAYHCAVAETLTERFSGVPGVEFVLGLGSLARGFADEWSDLDIAVLGRGEHLTRFWTGERWLAGLSVDLFVIDLDRSPPTTWDPERRQALEESRVLFHGRGHRVSSLRNVLKLRPRERRRALLDALFEIGWLGFSPTDWLMKDIYGYKWSLPPDQWLRRGCCASAHITIDRVLDKLIQLLFLLNHRRVPDPKWRRFLAPGLDVLPTGFLRAVEEIEALPRDAAHYRSRSERLLGLIAGAVRLLSREGILKGDLYSEFLGNSSDYNPGA